jgi:hypothetical protein
MFMRVIAHDTAHLRMRLWFPKLVTNDESQKHAHAQQKSRKDMCEVRTSSQQVAGIGVKLQMLLPNSCSMGYN